MSATPPRQTDPEQRVQLAGGATTAEGDSISAAESTGVTDEPGAGEGAPPVLQPEVVSEEGASEDEDEGVASEPRALPIESAGGFDPASGMMSRFGGLAGAFARRFFGGFGFEPDLVQRLTELEKRGAVAYVMRYSSRLDYLLFNWIFLRQGIRLSLYANGIHFFYYRPVHIGLRLWAETLWIRVRYGRAGLRARGLARVREILMQGGSFFLFLRTDKLSALQAKSRALASAGREVDHLRELVETEFETSAPVSLVPLALFWRKGPKPARRLIDVLYGAPNRPTTTWKLLSFVWTYKNLAVRVGEPVDLQRFVDQRRDEGVERATRQLRRALLIFLRREEKPVLGSALRPLLRIEEGVLQDPQVQAAIAHQAEEQKISALKVEHHARRHLREVAAHPSPTVLAILDVIVDWGFRKLFARIEVSGLDAVVEAAKLHPLVLIPSHRSHFDYLILSWLLYERHLAPPLVAAGANLSFFPVGTIFRRAGAFFLRRSFEGDPLYTAVFRSYIQLLIKDGITQEFFIEGTRSRTGKTLPPRTGMLGMILDAFRHGARRDLYIVPVGFTYERLVEEGSITEERRGAEKKPESALALLRARRIFESRFGAVTVRFGKPISLVQRTGLARKRGEGELAAGRSEELHDLSRRLGTEICREINGLISAGRSAVSAAALLGGPSRGTRVATFTRRLEEVAEVVRLTGQEWSANLARAIGRDRSVEAVHLLLQEGIVERRSSRQGDILTFSEGAREALVYYRASLLPFLVWPGVLGSLLANGVAREQESLLEMGAAALSLLRIEFFPPDLELQRKTYLQVLDHFQTRGWITRAPSAVSDSPKVVASGAGIPWMRFFAAQLRPMLETYGAVFEATVDLVASVSRKGLLERAQTLLEERLLLGEAEYPESVCSTTLANALQLLLDEEVLVADGNPRRPETELSLGPCVDRLADLRVRLARALVGR